MEFLPDVDVESASLAQIQCYYCGAKHDYRLMEVGCLQACAWEVAST